MGSTSYITNLDGDVVQHIEYVPFGEVFLEERNNKWDTLYLLNIKSLDEEAGLYYYGARYYNPRVSLWLGIDPMQEKYPNKTSYHYCSNNPVNRIDLTGEEDHVDGHGNVIARFDNNDKSVYMHEKGATKDQIEKQRKDNMFNGSIGTQIGSLGGNIDVSTIMNNLLSANSEEASTISGAVDMMKYKALVEQGAKWDLKNNESTIFGIAWSYDKKNRTNDSGGETKFSFSEYSGLNAADIGNYHAGYMGRFANIHSYLLYKGAGFAETTKEWSEGSKLTAIGRGIALIWPFSKQSGDRSKDYKWNTHRINDGDRDRTLKSLLSPLVE